MSDQGPTPDAYKMPLVILSFGQSLGRSAEFTGDIEALGLSRSRLAGTSRIVTTQEAANTLFQLPAWQYVEEFEYSFGDQKAFVATFTLFDIEFDRIFSLIATARNRKDLISVYFRFGWIVDGTDVRMSSEREGIVLDFEPEFLQDGARITFRVQERATVVKTLERVHNKAWPPWTPADQIVREAMELPPRATTALNSDMPRVRVSTPVPAMPLRNSGNDVVLNDQAPIPFLREQVVPYSVALSEDWRDVPYRLFESDKQRGRYIFAPTGWNEEGKVKPKRTYHVGRGQLGQVKSFKPTDVSAFANILGGAGAIRTILSQSKKTTEEGRAEITGDPTEKSGTTAPDVSQFYRFSFARDDRSLYIERQARWANAKSAAVQTEAEIIGDPAIHMHDLLQFYVYRGATLSTAGLYADTAESPRSSPTPLTFLSGLYEVINYTHRITSSGEFTTTLTLQNAVGRDTVLQRSQALDPDHSDDVTPPAPERRPRMATRTPTVERNIPQA